MYSGVCFGGILLLALKECRLRSTNEVVPLSGINLAQERFERSSSIDGDY